MKNDWVTIEWGYRWMKMRALFVLVWLCCSCTFVRAQELSGADDDVFRSTLPGLLERSFGSRPNSRRDSLEVLKLVRPVLNELRDSVVTVFVEGKPIALGTIVSPNGYAVTKASELGTGTLRVRLSDRRLLDAKVFAMRRSDDIALVKFEAQNLRAVRFESSEPAVGSFLVSAGVSGEVIGLGVVGNEARMIAERGVLGVGFNPNGIGVEVSNVLPGSGAAAAGIRRGDVLLTVNSKEIRDGQALRSEIELMFPGERAKLGIKRGEESLEIEVEVRDFSVVHETESDARVHGARSSRSAGFNRVLHHDTVLDPDQCGGPVVDLSGRVVGINIARAGRVTSYALTSQFLVPAVQSLLSGTTTP